MYPAYKLNKQGDNIQSWHIPFPIWNQSLVPYPVLTVASCPAYRFLKRQVRCSGIPISFRICGGPQLVMVHTVRSFGIVDKAEIDVFLDLSCFFNDPISMEMPMKRRNDNIYLYWAYMWVDGEGWSKQDKLGPLETNTKEKTKRKIDRKLGEAGGRNEIWGRIASEGLTEQRTSGKKPLRYPGKLTSRAKAKAEYTQHAGGREGQSGGVGCGSSLIEGSEEGCQWRVLNQRASWCTLSFIDSLWSLHRENTEEDGVATGGLLRYWIR